ncbi:hypothetical protein [Streptomyces sp. NPDC058092]|uniref:hypothetical protein n=1 Tax=Streptomyces sp. NPDC058092 TaxID=3346336 RepID=UPI0036E4118E
MARERESERDPTPTRGSLCCISQLITDAGSADLYGDGTEAKDLDHAEWRKSRATWFTVGS